MWRSLPCPGLVHAPPVVRPRPVETLRNRPPEPGLYRPPTAAQRARLERESAAQDERRRAQLRAALEPSEGQRWCANCLEKLARPGRTRCRRCASYFTRHGREHPLVPRKAPCCMNPYGCPMEIEKSDRCSACRKWRRRHAGEERPRAVIDEALSRRADRLRDQG